MKRKILCMLAAALVIALAVVVVCFICASGDDVASGDSDSEQAYSTAVTETTAPTVQGEQQNPTEEITEQTQPNTTPIQKSDPDETTPGYEIGTGGLPIMPMN